MSPLDWVPVSMRVIESGERWTAALRTTLREPAFGHWSPRVQTEGQLPGVVRPSTSRAPSVFLVEVGALNLEAGRALQLLRWTKQTAETPGCLPVVLLGRCDWDAEAAFREAGAVGVITSPRGVSAALKAMIPCVDALWDESEPDGSLEAAVLRRLPWQSAE